MKHALIAVALAASSFGAIAQKTTAPNTDRNLEAARSYGAFVPVDTHEPSVSKVEAEPADPVQGRVNGSASRDWTLRGVA
jgi:hypothetical protein